MPHRGDHPHRGDSNGIELQSVAVPVDRVLTARDGGLELSCGPCAMLLPLCGVAVSHDQGRGDEHGMIVVRLGLTAFVNLARRPDDARDKLQR